MAFKRYIQRYSQRSIFFVVLYFSLSKLILSYIKNIFIDFTHNLYYVMIYLKQTFNFTLPNWYVFICLSKVITLTSLSFVPTILSWTIECIFRLPLTTYLLRGWGSLFTLAEVHIPLVPSECRVSLINVVGGLKGSPRFIGSLLFVPITK